MPPHDPHGKEQCEEQDPWVAIGQACQHKVASVSRKPECRVWRHAHYVMIVLTLPPIQMPEPQVLARSQRDIKALKQQIFIMQPLPVDTKTWTLKTMCTYKHNELGIVSVLRSIRLHTTALHKTYQGSHD